MRFSDLFFFACAVFGMFCLGVARSKFNRWR
jgi:hypothetical protein